MLELYSQVVVGDGQDRQPLVRDLLPGLGVLVPALLAFELFEGDLQELVLQQNDGEHGMLLSIVVLVELAQHCAQVQVGVRQSRRLLHSEFQLQRLDQIRQGGPQLPRASVVAGQVVVRCRLVLQGVLRHQLGLTQVVQAHIELLLLQEDHRRKIQVLA